MKTLISLVGLLAGFFVLLLVGNVFGTFTSVATAPGRVVQRTLETDNIISNYEFFHDAHNQVKARVAQISGHKTIARDVIDPAEKSRVRIELAAIQQSCRELVGRYNSNATKTNRSIFMGREAPASLEPSICE